MAFSSNVFQTLICCISEFEPERKIQHEKNHHDHRRLEWVWRFNCAGLGKGGAHCLREHARDQGPECAAARRGEEVRQGYDVDLRAVELDVSSQESCDTAMQEIIVKNGRLDVVIHNAGHMVFGPAEAFTPEQLAELYDVNVLSTQRVNRAALPQLRKQRRGLVVWVS